MPVPKSETVRATASLGLVNGTTATLVLGTPVTLWGWSVSNSNSAVSNAGIGAATNAILTVPFAAGTTVVPTYGLDLDSVAVKLDHTNMVVTLYYTPGQ